LRTKEAALMSKQISSLERDLAAAAKRRDELEQRRELLQKEHGDAVTARRTLMLDGDGDLNVKALEKADGRVTTVEVSLAGTEDALAASREKIKQLDMALATARDQVQREGMASEIEARVPRLRDGISVVAPGLQALIAELRESGKPEGQAAGHLLADAWQQITLETDKIVAELGADARRLRITPTPAPVKPSPPPTPGLSLQPARLGDVVEQFVDWRQ
jgi:chromosome segregation ATPase